MIELKKVYDFYMSEEQVWIGAVETINTVTEHEKTAELMTLLGEIVCEATEIENEQLGV